MFRAAFRLLGCALLAELEEIQTIPDDDDDNDEATTHSTAAAALPHNLCTPHTHTLTYTFLTHTALRGLCANACQSPPHCDKCPA